MMNWKPYIGRMVCSGLGLLTALLFLTIGFWKTAVILLCCGIGYAAGTYKDTGRLRLVELLMSRIEKW